jgi:hypothetical protein
LKKLFFVRQENAAGSLGNQLKAYPGESWIPFSKGGARGWGDEQSHG